MRTNVVVDQSLISEVMGTYGLTSKRAAIDFALRAVLGKQEKITDPWKAMLELEGTWAGMSDEEAREIYDSDVSE